MSSPGFARPTIADASRLAVLGVSAFLAVACGDQCERLCADVGEVLEQCVCVDGKGNSCTTGPLTWQDAGASGPADFRNQCDLEWQRSRSDLSSSDLSLHIDACEETREKLASLTCDEVFALYGPID